MSYAFISYKREVEVGVGRVARASVGAMLATLLAFVLTVEPPAARAQASIVDTQMEVTTALVQSSLTIEAIKKADDAKCRELQARIDALSVQVKVGKAQKAALIAAKEALLARLADTDTVYKAEMNTFRGAVTDIASTPEGLAALAKYNAGDQPGALAILDKLQAADEAARHAATAVQDAVGERHIAELALDARGKGKVTTDSVIARYEAVVKLDPSVYSDWDSLYRLYLDVARSNDAEEALRRALAVAGDDYKRSYVEARLGDLLRARGDPTAANSAYEQALTAYVRWIVAAGANTAGGKDQARLLMRRIAEADAGFRSGGSPAAAEEVWEQVLSEIAATHRNNRQEQFDMAFDLARLGENSQSEGTLSVARKDEEDAVSIYRSLKASDPNSTAVQSGMAGALALLGDIRRQQGDLTGAARSYGEVVSITRRMADANPQNVGLAMNLAAATERTGDVLFAEGDLQGAENAYVQEVAISTEVSREDPTNADTSYRLSTALGHAGEVEQRRGQLADALQSYRLQLSIMRKLTGTDPKIVEYQLVLANALTNMASVEQNEEGAVAYLEAYNILRSLNNLDPDNKAVQAALSNMTPHLRLALPAH